LLQTFPFLPLQTLRATKTQPLQSLHGLCALANTCFSLRHFATSVFFLFLPEFRSSDIHMFFITHCTFYSTNVCIQFYLFSGRRDTKSGFLPGFYAQTSPTARDYKMLW